MTNRAIDIAIVGGGMVGAAAALGLARQGFKVVVIERKPPDDFIASSLPDVRISAISSASVRLLASIGVWTAISEMRCHAYQTLEAWEWQSAPLTFCARELGLTELGYMVENQVLQTALWQALLAHPNIRLHCPAQLIDIQRAQQGWRLIFSEGAELNVALVIGADGANSQVRQLAGIGIHAWQYRQSCLLISAQCETAPGQSTWQHFTPTGPHAFLPLFENWASLVWYDTPARIRQLQAMTMPQLQIAITAAFPARLGQVTPVACAAFPLVRRHALEYVQQGLALIGDAAHTIHPMAGQGVNLGYRDVESLLKVITDARNADQNWADVEVLKRYQQQRRLDNYLMQSSMDLLYAGFGNELKPLRVLRNLGMMVAARSGVLKRQALKYALGL